MLVLRARGGLLEQSLEYGIVRQLVERAVVGAAEEKREELLAGPAAPAAIALGLSEPAPDAGPGGDAAANIQHGLHWLVNNLAAEQPRAARRRRRPVGRLRLAARRWLPRPAPGRNRRA